MAYAVISLVPEINIIAIGSTGEETLELVRGHFIEVPCRKEKRAFLKACEASRDTKVFATAEVDFLGETLYVQNVL